MSGVSYGHTVGIGQWCDVIFRLSDAIDGEGTTLIQRGRHEHTTCIRSAPKLTIGKFVKLYFFGAELDLRQSTTAKSTSR